MRSLATNIIFENHQSAIRAIYRDARKISIYILSYRIYLSVPSISDRVAGFWSYDRAIQVLTFDGHLPLFSKGPEIS